MNRGTNEQRSKWTEEQMNRGANEQTNKWTNKLLNRGTERGSIFFSKLFAKTTNEQTNR